MPFPVDEKYILATERKLCLKFPVAFRTKMLTDNGGEVVTPPDAWQLHPFLDTSDKKRLRRTCNDIARETESAKEWPRFPEEAIAIGANAGGDRLILLPAGNGSFLGDEVYWWDHETGSVHKVADNFGELKRK